MEFITELKGRVENRFGRKINTKTDALNLRETIFQNQNEYLSESTIRRFFNLIPSGKTTQNTLNIFSRFIDFQSYSHFVEFCERLIYFSTTNNTDELILEGLKEKTSLTILEVYLIADRINYCLRDLNYDLLTVYFNNHQLNTLITQNESIHDLFAQAIGPQIVSDKIKLEVEPILKTLFFIPLVLHKYVDIQNKGLEKFYDWMILNPRDSHDVIFSSSILSLNNLYTGNHKIARAYYLKIKCNSNIHSPELIGRIELLKWVFLKDLNNLILTAKQYEEQILFFSIDIISYLVFIDDIKTLKTWFKAFPNISWDVKKWTEKEILFFYHVAKLLANDNINELNQILPKKIRILNSNTTLEKIYHVIEKRYLS
jgi:hypothetical protein